MGVVRREGDWRLKKQREGVYQITFQREPQLKIFTSDASARGGQQPMFNSTPVREVSSYPEAEGLFEEKANGPPPAGMEFTSNRSSTSDDLIPEGEDLDLSEVPPGVLGIALLFTGFFFLYTFWGAENDLLLLFGLGFAGGGLLILSYGGYLLKSKGWREAQEFLMTPDDGYGSSTTESEQEKTPPAPDSLKNELFFERANRRCEYCDEEFDQPDVHHIQPRSQGGPNEPGNLIVLCPNCHRKADRGAISQSKLKYKVKQQSEMMTESDQIHGKR